MTLTPEQARRFYDRFGSRQDSQGFYEDAALELLASHAGLDRAGAVFEFGCGTGRFAAGLLANHLPADSSYLGVEISSTMLRLAANKLARFGPRAKVSPIAARARFPLADQSVDRVLATYVLDLLSEEDIALALSESRRVLVSGGKLGLVGLTHGVSLTSRLVIALWSIAFRLNPSWVGGCRPVAVAPLLDRTQWELEYREVISACGIPSEVLVAAKR